MEWKTDWSRRRAWISNLLVEVGFLNVEIFYAQWFHILGKSVFWDLYCAATPGMREQFEPSNEAKAFHEYVSFKSL